jgi:hypothetical protein
MTDRPIDHIMVDLDTDEIVADEELGIRNNVEGSQNKSQNWYRSF